MKATNWKKIPAQHLDKGLVCRIIRILITIQQKEGGAKHLNEHFTKERIYTVTIRYTHAKMFSGSSSH